MKLFNQLFNYFGKVITYVIVHPFFIFAQLNFNRSRDDKNNLTSYSIRIYLFF